jgi:ferredoxin
MADDALVKVIVDSSKCSGHGRCYSLAPEIFESDEDGLAVVKLDAVGPDLRASLDRAMKLCPELAISIEPVQPTD